MDAWTMQEPTQPLNAIMVLGLLIAALIPASVVATLQSQLAWYHGLGLFYGVLGSAEVGYLGLLLALTWAERLAPFKALR
jgi:hypothetical protein